jgi:hypothetical protein
MQNKVVREIMVAVFRKERLVIVKMTPGNKYQFLGPEAVKSKSFLLSAKYVAFKIAA